MLLLTLIYVRMCMGEKNTNSTVVDYLVLEVLIFYIIC